MVSESLGSREPLIMLINQECQFSILDYVMRFDLLFLVKSQVVSN